MKEEKRKLLDHLKEQNQNAVNRDTVDHRKQSVSHQRRDQGVMCGVLTRHIGVGPQYPRTRTTSTITDEELTKLNQKLETTFVSQSSQTKIPSKEVGVQIPVTPKHFKNTSISAKPDVKEFGLQVQKETRTIGVSDDDVISNLCTKCNVLKRTIGVGPLDYADQHLPVSLKSLSVQKSKSFNLGEEKLNLNLRYRTIGCQSENFSVHKSSQYEHKSHSQHSQTDSKSYKNESVQYEHSSVSEKTDTHDLHPVKDASCATTRVITIDVSSNTVPPPVESKVKCSKCSGEAKKEEVSVPTTPIGSRIPRPAHLTTPTESRKFKRQDTYTKIPSVAPTEDHG